MKRVLVTGVLLLCIGLCGTAAEPDKPGPTAQQRTFLVWTKAINDLDLEAFKAFYSRNMQEKMAKQGWRETLKKYKTELDERYGDCRPEDFTFTFQPGEKAEGTLRITFKGKDSSSLKMIKEDDAWKINEY